MGVRRADQALVWDRIEPEPNSGCWIWLGYREVNGYGRIGRKHHYAHRLVYERLVGAIPPGLTLDHLCRNRSCVNPEHLEPVTIAVNVLRGVGITAVNASKTHCDAGHPLSGGNVRVWKRREKRYRVCVTCWAASYRRRNGVTRPRMGTSEELAGAVGGAG